MVLLVSLKLFWENPGQFPKISHHCAPHPLHVEQWIIKLSIPYLLPYLNWNLLWRNLIFGCRKSEGVYDHSRGETEDAITIAQMLRHQFLIILLTCCRCSGDFHWRSHPITCGKAAESRISYSDCTLIINLMRHLFQKLHSMRIIQEIETISYYRQIIAWATPPISTHHFHTGAEHFSRKIGDSNKDTEYFKIEFRA
jgi:hypothetical protein